MSWLAESAWLAWLGLALVLAAVEAATVDFVFLMLAGGALGGAAAAALGAGVWVQGLAAVGVAGVLLGFVRPLVRKRFTAPDSGPPIGVAAQIGRSALVISTVTGHDGRVKLGGETWSARTLPGADVCLPGQEVRVVSIEGATAIVTAVADPLSKE